MRHLSWTHFLQLLPLKTEAARWFYAQQSVESRWSVRELRHQIERKAFHRTDPTLVFKDPYFLDFLSLRRLVAIELKLDRFPSDFLFQLTADEKTEVVANCDHLQNLKFSKALPFAFTEHGAIQAANVLASSQAVEMGMKTESLEMSHDNFSRNTRLQLRQLLDAVRELTAPPEPPKRPTGFLTHEDKKTPKASTLTKGRKAP